MYFYAVMLQPQVYPLEKFTLQMHILRLMEVDRHPLLQSFIAQQLTIDFAIVTDGVLGFLNQ